MTTIAEGQQPLALINIFTVKTGRADELIALLSEATETTMRHRPGFVSANLHKSVDGTKVANYAQWRSKADFDSMLADPEAGKHIKAAEALVERYDPVMYTVAAVHEA